MCGVGEFCLVFSLKSEGFFSILCLVCNFFFLHVLSTMLFFYNAGKEWEQSRTKLLK